MSSIKARFSIGKVILISVAVLLTFIYVYYHFIFLDQFLKPLPANGMTVEERDDSDSKVLETLLLDIFNSVKSVEVSHETGTITIYTNIFIRETKALDMANDIKEELKFMIRGNSSLLTFEKYYNVEVVSKDGELIEE
jgi:hypothetical protein